MPVSWGADMRLYGRNDVSIVPVRPPPTSMPGWSCIPSVQERGMRGRRWLAAGCWSTHVFLPARACRMSPWKCFHSGAGARAMRGPVLHSVVLGVCMSLCAHLCTRVRVHMRVEAGVSGMFLHVRVFRCARMCQHKCTYVLMPLPLHTSANVSPNMGGQGCRAPSRCRRVCPPARASARSDNGR